jgi:hypothetical protein
MAVRTANIVAARGILSLKLGKLNTNILKPLRMLFGPL